MSSATRIPTLAAELADLLRDRPHFVEFLGELADASRNDVQAAAPLYQSLAMWGGMGSLADEAGVDLPPQGRRRVLELLIALFEEFEEAGIHYDRAAFWTSTFRSWLDDGSLELAGVS